MASLVRRLLDRAATSSAPTVPLPRRGDHVEAWLKQQRDQHRAQTDDWVHIDELLDQYRLHADTRTPLDQHCCEGGNRDDCAGCYDTQKGTQA